MKIRNLFKKKSTPVISNSNDINWKREVPIEPTYVAFNNAWLIIFGHRFENCKVSNVRSGINTGFTVKTPEGTHVHGGFGEHIENPRLENPDDIYYEGCGCSWAIDLDGMRYYKLDRKTNMPRYFKDVYATEIIRRYIINNSMPIQKSLQS